MIDTRGEVLYVGKAKNLRKRVAHYFLRNKQHSSKIQSLVPQIRRVETIVVRNEKEALLLESQLIKSLKPKYNQLLKDDKHFPYLKLSIHEPFPRLSVTRFRSPDGALYFGPYPSMGSTRRLLRVLTDIFLIRDCTQSISLDKCEPKCINLDIGKCSGPCIHKAIKSQYDIWIQHIILFLKGKDTQVIKQLQQDMVAMSAALKFEKAADLRDSIAKLSHLIDSQAVHLSNKQSFQVWAYSHYKACHYILIQGYEEGKLLTQKGVYLVASSSDDLGALVQRAEETFWDDETLFSHPILCDDLLFPYLSDSDNKGRYASVRCPKRGIKYQLLELAQKNAKIAAHRVVVERGINDKMSLDRSAIIAQLKLRFLPDLIWGIDISHLHGSHIVGSLVCYRGFKPVKSGYRRYKIKSVTQTSNDVQSIYEVVLRSLSSAAEQSRDLPNLLFIDGGLPQIRAAHRAVLELGLDDRLDCLSLAKRDERLYRIGMKAPIHLDKGSPILRFFQSVRDDAHRFAISFQKLQRKQDLKSVLTTIPGIGVSRAARLYQIYRTLNLLSQSSVQDIAQSVNISDRLAEEVLSVVQSLNLGDRVV